MIFFYRLLHVECNDCNLEHKCARSGNFFHQMIVDGKFDLKSLLTKLWFPGTLETFPNPEQTQSCLKTQPSKKF